MSSTDPTSDPFYVGYLPAPPAHRRFALRVVATLVLVAALTAGVIAAMQRDPGDAVWDMDHPQTAQGWIELEPYPHLQRTSHGEVDLVLFLVGEGKHGARERLAALEGKHVKLRGTMLTRGDLALLEIADDLDAITVLDEDHLTTTRPAAAMRRQPVALSGEIVDPKCYAGAMKPGGGKTHKSCAALCLRGGIPPAFVTTDDAGRTTIYLLTAPDGRGLSQAQVESLLPLIGEPVELQGITGDVAGVPLLSIDPADVHRR